MMRLASAFVLLAPLVGCVGEDLLSYDEEVSDEITVPGQDILGGNPLVADQVFPADFGVTLASALEQSFSTQDVDPAAVKSLTVTAMKAVVEDPNEGNTKVRHMGFISSLSFDMSADGVEPIRVAESAPGVFDDDPVEVDFETTGEELKELLEDDAMTMKANLETDNQPTFATTITFTVTVHVEADLAGAAGSLF